MNFLKCSGVLVFAICVALSLIWLTHRAVDGMIKIGWIKL